MTLLPVVVGGEAVIDRRKRQVCRFTNHLLLVKLVEASYSFSLFNLISGRHYAPPVCVAIVVSTCVSGSQMYNNTFVQCQKCDLK